MFVISIFAKEIIALLNAHAFHRTDEGEDKNCMSWEKDSTLMVFTSNDITVYAISDDGLVLCYKLKGFPPADTKLFTVLMNSWGIISYNEMKIEISNDALTKINLN